jgi:hypothetical protein
MYPLTAVMEPGQEGKAGLDLTLPSWDRARDLAKIVNWTGKTRGTLLNDGNVIIAEYSDKTFDVVHTESGERKNLSAEKVAEIGAAKMQRIGPLSKSMGQLDAIGGGVQDILDALIIPGGFEVGDLSEISQRARERYYGERGTFIGSDLIDPLMALPIPIGKLLKPGRPIRTAKGARVPIPETAVPMPVAEIWNALDDAARVKVITPLQWTPKKRSKAPKAVVQAEWDDLLPGQQNAIKKAIEESPAAVKVAAVKVAGETTITHPKSGDIIETYGNPDRYGDDISSALQQKYYDIDAGLDPFKGGNIDRYRFRSKYHLKAEQDAINEGWILGDTSKRNMDIARKHADRADALAAADNSILRPNEGTVADNVLPRVPEMDVQAFAAKATTSRLRESRVCPVGEDWTIYLQLYPDLGFIWMSLSRKIFSEDWGKQFLKTL